jgi:tetratricopeptide (TPR) repeat protein
MIGQVFAREWQAVGHIVAIYTGGDEAARAISQLQLRIEDFETLLRGHSLGGMPEGGLSLAAPPFRNRLLNVLAQCMVYAGYGNATLNAFSRAQDYYRRAEFLLVYANPRLETLTAEVKNNRARALGELGYLDDAVTLCDEGAAINSELGLDYSLAIAHNTRALIYTTNQRPEQSPQFAQLAMRLFRQRLDLRGIGLALIQLGEGRRRSWWIETEQRVQSGLGPLTSWATQTELARDNLLGAIRIFKKIQEPLRLMESLSALACLYRDRANYLRQGPEGKDFVQALTYFDQARAIADEKGYLSQKLAILADRAWLYKRAGGYAGKPHYPAAEHLSAEELYATAAQIAAEALACAPPHLLITPGQPLDVGVVREQIGALRELSKLAALRADIAAVHSADVHLDSAERQQHFWLSVEQRILAMVYLQIFAPTNAYLAQNRRKLQRLLSWQQRKTPALRQQVLEHIEHLEQIYDLAAIEAHIGEHSYRQVLNELFTPPSGIDYV